MQADGGLAASRRALHNDGSRGRPADELELARVDERGDGRQEAVLAPAAVAFETESRAYQRRLPRGRCAQAQLPGTYRSPAWIGGIASEDPLRRGHAPQFRIDDGHRPAGKDLALDLPFAQPLLEAVPLLVTVEEPRHWGVPPVHDLHGATGLDEAALADQDVAAAAVLLQAKVAKIGAPPIDRRAFALPALAGKRLDPMHLFEQWPLVLRLGLGQGVA